MSIWDDDSVREGARRIAKAVGMTTKEVVVAVGRDLWAGLEAPEAITTLRWCTVHECGWSVDDPDAGCLEPGCDAEPQDGHHRHMNERTRTQGGDAT